MNAPRHNLKKTRPSAHSGRSSGNAGYTAAGSPPLPLILVGATLQPAHRPFR
ncbi:hypothetical protein PtB15_2B888 [Puccinia triticina]|nr:hypothetical protein PtB15_2B888 [Puccinia triticina]